MSHHLTLPPRRKIYGGGATHLVGVALDLRALRLQRHALPVQLVLVHGLGGKLLHDGVEVRENQHEGADDALGPQEGGLYAVQRRGREAAPGDGRAVIPDPPPSAA